MNEIVKYDNYMNSLNFSQFNKVDMNLLIALCSRMKDKNTQKIDFSFDVLRELTNYKKSNSIEQFAEDLEKMNEKLMRVTCKLKTKTEILMFVLFPTFKINKEMQILTVSVNEDFKFILNELVKNFTRFDLKEFIELDSKYSKSLYRLLKQYRSTGKYEVSINDFRQKMDCPVSYSNKYIMDLIIKPSLNEIQKYFSNLQCTTKYAHKRGGPIAGYIFTFTPEKVKNGVIQKERKHNYHNHKNVPEKSANFSQRTYDYEEIERELLKRSEPKCDNSEIEEILRKNNLI